MSLMSLRGVVTILVIISGYLVAEKIRYMSTERPVLCYYNPKYFVYFNVTCQRYGRQNPIYYVGGHFEAKYICNNNLSADVYFYEFLTNQYKRSFVEMHFRICDVIEKDTFFGDNLRQGILKSGCPIQAGIYHLYNMSLPVKNIPYNFPFSKGRIYLNMTSTDTSELIFTGHIDMEIKEYNFKQRKPRSYSRPEIEAKSGVSGVYNITDIL